MSILIASGPSNTCLPGHTRDLLEHGFGQRLRDVPIQLWPDALPWPSARGCVIGNTVHLRASDFCPDTPFGLALLAHEFAHVVQKGRRLWQGSGSLAKRCRPPTWRVEAEAAAASVAVIAGQRVRCMVGDLPSIPRFWGFAGHYYTVYFVMLAAGVDDLTAGRLAFYAQMPDQVKELSATAAGIDLVVTRAKSKVLDPFDRSQANLPSRLERIGRDYEVQQGLHALTGGPSMAETQIRAGHLRSLPFGSFPFGIALHPYGDSFAHRQMRHGERMYDAGMGHARDGHGPDHIQERRDLYLQYLEGLYEIVVGRTPHQQRRLDRTGLVARALDIMSIGGDAAQGARMRQIAAHDLGCVMNAYRPEHEKTTSWKHFCEHHPEVSGHLLDEALALAHRWTVARAA